MKLTTTATFTGLFTSAVLSARAVSVNLRSTEVVGRDIPTLGQQFFGGIPYAEAPVGSLRLRPPVLKTSLDTPTFNATSYGKGCIQPSTDVTSFSEDCLFLNILRPTTTVSLNPTKQLPVFVWIYGGGFITGDSASFNGSAIVAQSVARGTPVIFASLNYRTGPLGFPQGAEAAADGALNLGLRDQVTALQWIQANIGAFGGDKTKVTVFGESAGAASIAVHQLRPDLATLARGVILQSGSGSITLSNFAATRELDFAHFVGSVPACASFAGQSGALACLRSAPNVTAVQLIQASAAGVLLSTEQFPFVPTLGDEIYPALPSVVLKAGNFSKIPFIAGTNLDEGTAFVPFPQNVGPDTARQWLVANFTPSLLSTNGEATLVDDADRLLDLYPDVPALGSPYATGNETFGFDKAFKRVAALVGDLSFQSQRRLLQQETAKAGVPSYGYLFTDPQPQIPAYYGVTHGQDVNYVFGNCASKSAASQALCVRMIDYWVSFVVSQTPNDGKGTLRPTWTQYTPDHKVLVELNGSNTTLIADDYRKKQIDFINENSVVFHHRRAT